MRGTETPGDSTPAGRNPIVTVRYPKRWFLAGTVVWIVLTALLVFLYSESIETFAKTLYGVLAAVEGALFFFIAFTPLVTNHSAGDRGLRLKMGLLIDMNVPYAWIAEAKDTTMSWGGFRVGIGVRYFRQSKTLFVTSAFDQLVSLRLDQEHALGRVFPKQVREVVLSVDSARAFIRMIERRQGRLLEV